MTKAPVSGSRERPFDILVVEDDDDARSLMRALMRQHGHVVRTARCGADAREEVAARVPDVVVLDLQLGDETGADLAIEWREAAATRDMGILGISGRVEPTWRVVRPFDAFVQKPARLDVIVALVGQLAERARAIRQSRTG